MGYDSCPLFYSAYGAKILRSKYCKDKQNWSSETGLLKIWLTWNINRIGLNWDSFRQSPLTKNKNHVNV
jgi:hypothetical protein